MTNKPTTFTAFATEHQIEMSVCRIDARPDGTNDGWATDARHFKITLTTSLDSMVTYFSQGSAHKADPTIGTVLSCLRSDAGAYNLSFEEWCSEYGYDDDSRKAERTYNACRDTAADLENLLGPGGFDALMEGRFEDE
jgi:hypothetical protein